MNSNNILDTQIINCKKCPRLIDYCNTIAEKKKKQYINWDYWGKPVPNFGDSKAEVLVIGLAPAAHGANRTGRMFTGDRSGDWLYRALYKAGFANQANSISIKDDLSLKNCLVTAVCHCAPPQNKPSKIELKQCQNWLLKTITNSSVKFYITLGKIAWDHTFDTLKILELFEGARPKFFHGSIQKLNNQTTVIGSYHPSQQNTFTGKLTEKMFDDIFKIVIENK